jgi:hypothetical protein
MGDLGGVPGFATSCGYLEEREVKKFIELKLIYFSHPLCQLLLIF